MRAHIEKAVYLTNLRKLGFGECRRFGGSPLKGLLFWSISRFVPPQGETELPVGYDEMEARPEDLSANFHEYHTAWQTQFSAAGFRAVGWQKVRNSKDKNHIDSGSVIYLSSDSRVVGILSLIIASDKTQPSGIRVTEGCGMTAYLDDHRTLTATNLDIYLDPRPGCVVVHRKGAALAELHAHAMRLVTRSGSAPRSFGGWPDLRAVMEDDDRRNFLHRRDVRRLYVPKSSSHGSAKR